MQQRDNDDDRSIGDHRRSDDDDDSDAKPWMCDTERKEDQHEEQ